MAHAIHCVLDTDDIRAILRQALDGFDGQIPPGERRKVVEEYGQAGDKAVYLLKVESDNEIRVNTWVGKRLSLHSSSLGKILLAWLRQKELESRLQDFDWRKKTPGTITDVDRFRAHLADVRGRGWACDDEEDITNLRCVAAPVLNNEGRAIAAISAVGTILGICRERFEPFARQVCESARNISAIQGHSTTWIERELPGGAILARTKNRPCSAVFSRQIPISKDPFSTFHLNGNLSQPKTPVF